MAFCENCGTPHGNGKYCGSCGAPLPGPPPPGREGATKADSAIGHALGTPPMTGDKASSPPSPRPRLLIFAGAGMGALAIAGTAYFGLQLLQSSPPPPTELVATITAPDGGFGAAGAFLPDGSALYVASEDGVTVVDPETNSVVDSIALGPIDTGDTYEVVGGLRVVPSQDGKTVYVLDVDCSLTAIDTLNNSVADYVDLGVSCYDMIFSNEDTQLLVAMAVYESSEYVGDAVIALDSESLYPTEFLLEGGDLASFTKAKFDEREVLFTRPTMVIPSGHSDLYILAYDEVYEEVPGIGPVKQDVAKAIQVDLTSGTISAEYPARYANQITLNPVRPIVYASAVYSCSDERADGGSSRVDIETGTSDFIDLCVVGAVPGAEQVFGYTAEGSLAVIDAKTENVLRTIPVPTSDDLLIARRGKIADAYVVDGEKNRVTVVPGDGDAALATIPVGEAPYPIAAAPDGSAVYISNLEDGTISVIGRS